MPVKRYEKGLAFLIAKTYLLNFAGTFLIWKLRMSGKRYMCKEERPPFS